MTDINEFLPSDPSWRDPDDALRDLLERRDRILAMQETDGWRLWCDFLAAVSGAYQNRLLRGRHSDMETYKFEAGVVEGIRLAVSASSVLDGKIAAARRILEDSRPLAEQAGLLAEMEILNG